jgi:hypothetical protein
VRLCEHEDFAALLVATAKVRGLNEQFVEKDYYELARALGVGDRDFGRQRAEVRVDSVVFCPDEANGGLGAGRSVGDGCHRRWAGAIRCGRRRGARRAVRRW